MAALLSGNMEGGLYMYNVCEITFVDIVAAVLFNSFVFFFSRDSGAGTCKNHWSEITCLNNKHPWEL